MFRLYAYYIVEITKLGVYEHYIKLTTPFHGENIILSEKYDKYDLSRILKSRWFFLTNSTSILTYIKSYHYHLFTFYIFVITLVFIRPCGRRGCDRMIVGFTTTYAINAYHH
jgi:hypothetical protein